MSLNKAILRKVLEEKRLLKWAVKIGSKYKITIENKKVESDGIVGLIALNENSKINFLNNNFVFAKGTVIGFKSSVQYKINSNEWKVCIFSYKNREAIGNGKYEFEIIATVKDQYRIKILANSYDEAKKIAYETNISNWDHPDIAPDLQDRVLLRFAKWGNFIINRC